MPLISERKGAAGMEPATPTQPIQAPIAHFTPAVPMELGANGFTRCPLPPIYTTNVDNIKNFYKGGKVPQIRIYPQALKGNS
jgi:hypothetical protein